MNDYIRTVNYYETDRMGITHHSNYIRWMEEARVDYLEQLGYGLKRLEDEGVTSPVVEVACRYRQTTTFADEVRIHVAVEQYTGVKLTLNYTITNTATDALVFTGTSSHCFIDGKGRPLAMKKRFPEFDGALRGAMGQE